MENLKEELKRYKWIMLAGVIVALVVGLITANIHVINFISYKMQGDTSSIITLLESDIQNVARQDDWYFVKGTEYLLENLEEESQSFFEQYFTTLIPERQKDVIEGYNKKNLLFANNNELIAMLIENIDKESFQGYLKRLDEAQLDAALAFYFGDKVEVNERLINILDQITKVYPKSLALDKFQFNLYELLVMTGDEIEVKKNQIFSKLNPERARKIIFEELKTKPVDGDTLKGWIEFLNKNKIIDTKEYTEFSSIYSEIYLIRKQYKELDAREVDLKNKKETIELQIGDKLIVLDEKNKTLVEQTSQITTIENELSTLTDYAYMALYIEKSYGNGEYEASIPRKNIFGNYKPSSQKYIIKLNNTEFYQEGVYYVDISLQGTKVNSKGEEYPYYVEVSKEQLARIESLQAQRQTKVEEAQKLREEIASLEAEISSIKAETGYNQNEQDLKDLLIERENLEKKIEEKAVQIKNLLGIGGVTVTLVQP